MKGFKTGGQVQVNTPAHYLKIALHPRAQTYQEHNLVVSTVKEAALANSSPTSGVNDPTLVYPPFLARQDKAINQDWDGSSFKTPGLARTRKAQERAGGAGSLETLLASYIKVTDLSSFEHLRQKVQKGTPRRQTRLVDVVQECHIVKPNMQDVNDLNSSPISFPQRHLLNLPYQAS